MTQLTAKKKTQKTQRKSVDSFAPFKKATTEIFRFLTTDFGFGYVNTLEHMPDCVSQYQNETTGIRVYYELKSQLSVDIVKLSHTATEVIEDKSYDLLLLMEIRQPETDAHEFYGGDKEWTNEYVEKLLRQYATFVKEDARDVLTGDFSIFPQLKKLSAHHRRQTNKELFGTYTGGSPRFSTRPTLDQVFAGAKDVDHELERLFGGKLNQDKTQSRIYEAYWDHQYSTKEIAGFLSVTEKAIRQALSDFDDQD